MDPFLFHNCQKDLSVAQVLLVNQCSPSSRGLSCIVLERRRTKGLQPIPNLTILARECSSALQLLAIRLRLATMQLLSRSVLKQLVMKPNPPPLVFSSKSASKYSVALLLSVWMRFRNYDTKERSDISWNRNLDDIAKSERCKLWFTVPPRLNIISNFLRNLLHVYLKYKHITDN